MSVIYSSTILYWGFFFCGFLFILFCYAFPSLPAVLNSKYDEVTEDFKLLQFTELIAFLSTQTHYKDRKAVKLSAFFQVLDGHFVHYFAPRDLPVVPKNVVFVIDTSASMVGTKIRQVIYSVDWSNQFFTLRIIYIQHFSCESCSVLFSQRGNDIVPLFFLAGFCDLIVGHTDTHTHLIAKWQSSIVLFLISLTQTKEALFTILRELRPSDHFNFVTFSNRIRVWQQGKLVPVTPNNIRDAKKFIYMISPTGGRKFYTLLNTPCYTFKQH